jgi:3-oxoacyl-(acyl-carrier-protein) synthase
MDRAMTIPRVAVAGVGAVTALGCGFHILEQSILSNVSALRHCPRLSEKPFQSSVTGFVPDEVWHKLR